MKETATIDEGHYKQITWKTEKVRSDCVHHRHSTTYEARDGWDLLPFLLAGVSD